MLQTLTHHEPAEVLGILSKLTFELSPKPSFEGEESRQERVDLRSNKVIAEIRDRLKLSPDDHSDAASDAILEFISNQISEVVLGQADEDAIRDRLADKGLLRPELEQPYTPPRNALESFLSQRWAEVLELDRVGVFDKFFELGGTSLQAARFVNRLQQELGEFIYVVTIFEAPSVAEYATMLRRDYPVALAKHFGKEASGHPEARTATGIDAATGPTVDVEEA